MRQTPDNLTLVQPSDNDNMSSHKLKPNRQFRPFGSAEDEEDNEKQKVTPVMVCDKKSAPPKAAEQADFLYLSTAQQSVHLLYMI